MTGQLELTLIDPLADALAWKRLNPGAYAAFLEWAAEDRANRYDPCIDLYVNIARRPHFARKLGLRRTDAVYAINNNLRSRIARLANREHDAGFVTRGAL